MIANQVKFKDFEQDIYGGIIIDNEYIICGCCGGVFEVEEIGKENIKILPWVSLDIEILGDEEIEG